MGGRRLQISSPLDTALAKIANQEKNLWGRIQNWSHRCLVRLESIPLLQNYNSFLKGREGVAVFGRKPTIDLDSLFFLSLLFHLLLFFLLTRITLPPSLPDNAAPIRVSFLDLGDPVQAQTEKAEKKQEKIARVQPNISRPLPKMEPVPISPPSQAAPLLPAPKALAQIPAREVVAPSKESLETLIHLPTKQPEAAQASPAMEIDPLPAVAAEQAMSLPKELRGGESVQTASKRKPGTSSGRSNPDFDAYIRMIEQRVKSMWRYPESVTGSQLVYLSFVLDHTGKLLRVEVVDSTDARLNSSAIEAMKRASPFPSMPDSIKELAGIELFVKFPVTIGVKGAR